MASSLSVPYAILPSTHEINIEEINTIVTHCNTIGMLENKEGAWCVGSSHGWLVLLDKEGCPFLVNPSSTTTSIYLPPFSHEFIRRANGQSYSYYLQTLRETFVSKAVLKSSPSPSQYTVAILYSTFPCKIAFCHNTTTTWTELENSDARRFYCDIVFSNNNLYALTEDGYVEGWDIHQQVPCKILDVKPTMEIDEEERNFSRGMFSTQIYLVISNGEFLLVKRFIGNFVNDDGEVLVDEGYILEGGICAYMTKYFTVYKLCWEKNRWEKMKSLNDRVLFVGANESTSMVAKGPCKANSIYFTDDRWEEMTLDYEYGGHDWGIFDLQDKSVKLLTPYTKKMDLPPIWVVPSDDSISF